MPEGQQLKLSVARSVRWMEVVIGIFDARHYSPTGALIALARTYRLTLQRMRISEIPAGRQRKNNSEELGSAADYINLRCSYIARKDHQHLHSHISEGYLPLIITATNP